MKRIAFATSVFFVSLSSFAGSKGIGLSEKLVEKVSSADPSLRPATGFDTTCSDAAAGAYRDLCARFTTEVGTVRCLEAGKNRYFATCSLDLCQRFMTENGAVRCLETIRDRQYSVEEMDFCGRFTTEQGAISCLSTSGWDYRGSDKPSMERIKREIELSLDYLEEGRTEVGIDILKDLLVKIGN